MLEMLDKEPFYSLGAGIGIITFAFWIALFLFCFGVYYLTR